MPDFTLINNCQICAQPTSRFMSLGRLPLVDVFLDSPRFDSPFGFCASCQLVQIENIVDPSLVFPENYPYTTGTTRQLRDNFNNLALDAIKSLRLNSNSLVVDIGCNDGTLLSFFKPFTKVAGITPEYNGQLAINKGIPVIRRYFDNIAVKKLLAVHGQADVICATNIFAHIPNPQEFLKQIKQTLKPSGVFICECDYLDCTLNQMQYDTMHHEHLRYYRLQSLIRLLSQQNLNIFDASITSSHGGALRIYASSNLVDETNNFKKLLNQEQANPLTIELLNIFAKTVSKHRSMLTNTIHSLHTSGKRIAAIGAPGRGVVLLSASNINYPMIETCYEIKGSTKIGLNLPGTSINIIDEENLYPNQPDYLLFLSWHIAHEIMPVIKSRGYRGDFLIPLPSIKIIQNGEA